MRWIQFQDSATDCHWVPVKDIHAMLIADANDLLVKFRNYTAPTEAVSDNLITITDTGRALTLGKEVADFISGTKVGGANCLVIKASGDGISSSVSTVAYTAGS